LHIVQLRVMHRLTEVELFARFAYRWEKFLSSRSGRTRAICGKALFKLLYY